MTPFNTRQLCQFDRFRLDLGKKVLWDNDELVHLPPKAVELLCELIEKRGEVVTKDELLSRVWPDAFVEEGVLTQNIHYLRKTFKDLNLPSDPIQTVPRRGYRFAGEVHSVPDEIVFEHEVVERNYLAEISSDSLKDLGVRGSRTMAGARISRGMLAAALVLVLVAVASTLLVVWKQVPQQETATINGISSIAVLPLKPLNSGETEQTFALGLTDSIIARFGRLSSLSVRPFSAVDKFGSSGKDSITFARDLKVDAVLEGTIQKADSRLRVSLQLIDTRDGSQIWNDTFDESDNAVLKLQDAISVRVSRALFTRLHPRDEQLLAQAPTQNQEAYRLYLAGREAWLKRDGRMDSVSFYEKAIELDPNFALPHLGIADQYAFTYETEIAERELAKALELDPDLAEAHATRGFLQMFHHWDWAGAEASFRRALQLAPGSSKAHHWFAVYLSLRGKLDDAKAEMQRALELDPTASVIRSDLAELYYFEHDYDRAEKELERVVADDPGFYPARQHLIKVRFKNGASYLLEEAKFNVFRQKKLKADGLTPEVDPRILEELVAKGDERRLRESFLQASSLAAAVGRPETYLGRSRYFSMMGEKEKSLDDLERAIEARIFTVPFVVVDPLWDPVRNEPRFQELMKRMNL